MKKLCFLLIALFIANTQAGDLEIIKNNAIPCNIIFNKTIPKKMLDWEEVPTEKPKIWVHYDADTNTIVGYHHYERLATWVTIDYNTDEVKSWSVKMKSDSHETFQLPCSDFKAKMIVLAAISKLEQTLPKNPQALASLFVKGHYLY